MYVTNTSLDVINYLWCVYKHCCILWIEFSLKPWYHCSKKKCDCLSKNILRSWKYKNVLLVSTAVKRLALHPYSFMISNSFLSFNVLHMICNCSSKSFTYFYISFFIHNIWQLNWIWHWTILHIVFSTFDINCLKIYLTLYYWLKDYPKFKFPTL